MFRSKNQTGHHLICNNLKVICYKTKFFNQTMFLGIEWVCLFVIQYDSDILFIFKYFKCMLSLPLYYWSALYRNVTCIQALKYKYARETMGYEKWLNGVMFIENKLSLGMEKGHRKKMGERAIQYWNSKNYCTYLTSMIHLCNQMNSIHCIWQTAATCSTNEYQCADGVTCIPNSHLCDSSLDCPGGDDEESTNCKIL